MTSSSPAGRSTSTGAVAVSTPPIVAGVGSAGSARVSFEGSVVRGLGGGSDGGDERAVELLDHRRAVPQGPALLVVVHAGDLAAVGADLDPVGVLRCAGAAEVADDAGEQRDG